MINSTSAVSHSSSVYSDDSVLDEMSINELSINRATSVQNIHAHLIPQSAVMNTLVWPSRAGSKSASNNRVIHDHGVVSTVSVPVKRGSVQLFQAESAQALRRARLATQERVFSLHKRLSENGLSREKYSQLTNRMSRLQHRLYDLKLIPEYLAQHELEFVGFTGWDASSAERVKMRNNVSQFESVLAKNKSGGLVRIPLDSRVKKYKGIEIDLIHSDSAPHHQHWLSLQLVASLNSSVRWQMTHDKDGCPCCFGELDLDEFASAVKQLSKAKPGSDYLLKSAKLDSPEHWGIYLGVIAPMALVGLTEAIRNVKGSLKNRKNLNLLIMGLSKDIAALKKTGNVQDVIKLEAFRKCLAYSKFNANYNLLIPGVTSGVASLLSLSAAFLSHPFALIAVGLYAMGQTLRNAADTIKVISSKPEKLMVGDSVQLVGGKQKVNQIQNSKFRAYLANSIGSAAFSAGSVITFISALGIPVFGLGALTLPVGLGLLAFGALSTWGINNIWIKNFRLQNFDLVKLSTNFKVPNDVLLEISQLQKVKRLLKEVKPSLFEPHRATKFGFKFLASMPESTDFLPKKWAHRVSDFHKKNISFLPVTGEHAIEKKHQFNINLVRALHHEHEKSLNSLKTRVSLLSHLPDLESNETPVTQGKSIKELTIQSWRLLVKQNLHHPVIQDWMNERELNSRHPIKFPGLNSESENWKKFNFDEFISSCNEEQLFELNVAIDHYLFFKLEKVLRYKVFGLDDYFKAWKKELNKDASLRPV